MLTTTEAETRPRTFLDVIEVASSSPSRRRAYFYIILIAAAIFGIKNVVDLWNLRSAPSRQLLDFDIFYIAGQLTWRGELEKAYNFADMAKMQVSVSGGSYFAPWTYPPQFALFMALLALLPLGLAYSLFIAGTFAAFVAALKGIGDKCFVAVLILFFPIVCVVIASGQNGFLTGALIGTTCILLRAGRASAGLPLGLMIIKPHLAVAFAVYVLVNRRWGAALVAAGTVAATSVLAACLLGPGIWIVFASAVKVAQVSLAQGFYPLYRMISPYAAVRAFGFSALTGAAAQLLAAVFALVAVVLARRRFSLQQSLGVTAVASLLISPYAYDYDLLIAGIGLALLSPDLIRLASERERMALYGLILFAGSFSLAQSARLAIRPVPEVTDISVMPLSLAGCALPVILGLIWIILRRDRQAAVLAQGG